MKEKKTNQINKGRMSSSSWQMRMEIFVQWNRRNSIITSSNGLVASTRSYLVYCVPFPEVYFLQNVFKFICGMNLGLNSRFVRARSWCGVIRPFKTALDSKNHKKDVWSLVYFVCIYNAHTVYTHERPVHIFQIAHKNRIILSVKTIWSHAYTRKKSQHINNIRYKQIA